MTAAQAWEISQIGGEGKSITLSGYAAPFGRPRHKPVVKEFIKSRVQTTNYPGRRGPTRHSFKTVYEPIELHGRWMTKVLHRGQTANELADLVSELVQDELPCTIAWGNIVSYTGYLEELELARESEHEIAWRLKILIDYRDADEKDAPIKAPTKIATGLPELDFELQALKLKNPGDLANSIAGLAAEFEDAVDGFVRDLNGPSATINRLAGVFSDTEKATFSTLQHLRSAFKGFEQAYENIRNTILITPIDTAFAVRTVNSDVDWIQYQLDLDTKGNDLMALIAAMDRKAEIRQREEVKGIIVAKGEDMVRGESWESISIRATGTAANADRIRKMNGGIGHATPGEEYVF